MSNKRKARVRVLKAKLNISYQAADNILKAGRRDASEADDRQVIQTFAVDGAMTFSARCAACGRWIWCGKEEHDGVCACGHPYVVVFRDADWALLSTLKLFGGRRCMDCGAEFKLRTQPTSAVFDHSHIYPEHRRHDPWHAVNEAQQQCNRCFLSNKDVLSNAVVVRKLPFRFRGQMGDQLPQVGVRRLTREEFAEATVEADRYVVRLVGDDTPLAPGLRPDLDAPEDMGVVARAFRDADDLNMPAFPSADWIGRHLTGDEVKAFVGFYFETIRSI
jgi:hypothetical protein